MKIKSALKKKWVLPIYRQSFFCGCQSLFCAQCIFKKKKFQDVPARPNHRSCENMRGQIPPLSCVVLDFQNTLGSPRPQGTMPTFTVHPWPLLPILPNRQSMWVLCRGLPASSCPSQVRYWAGKAAMIAVL